VLQSANASDVVSLPPSDSLDFSRPFTHVSESAAQVATTTSNQLSHQEASDTQYLGPFADMILSVRSFALRYCFHTIIWLRFGSAAASGPQYQPRFPNANFPTRRSQLSYYPTTLIDLPPTGHIPSSIGHVLRFSIARIHRVNCHRLSSSSLCLPSLARLPCSTYQRLIKTYVFSLILT
jgi:hypothetical protein